MTDDKETCAVNNEVMLNNGLVMPLLGLGTWKSKPGQVKEAVFKSIEIGYRHIDAAWIYENQHEVGEGVAQAISEGIINRKDVWITSKLWNSFHSASDVEEHLRDTLRQLNMDYLDLYLIHWPVTGIEAEVLTPSIQETWLAMEALVEKGLVKTIGVSNFSLKKLLAMKEYATIFPAVNQVELHPLLRQDELLEGCKELGVHLTAYSPLGSPDSADMFAHEGAKPLQHPVVNAIATESNKTPGQVLIKWALQRGTSAVPKSVTPSRIAENFDLFSWVLSDEAMGELSSIEPQQRMLSGKFFVKAAGPYRSVEELWD